MPVKIVFIISGLEMGGAENMLYKLLTHIDRARFEAMVVSLTGLGEYGPRIQALGIPVVALEMRTPWKALVAFPRLVQLLRKFRPALVHTWLYHADLIGGVAARLAGVSHVCWGIRNSNLNEDSLGRSVKWSRSLCARLSHWIPSRIVLNSEAARLFHMGLGYDGSRMVVLHNGFDVSRFKPDDQARRMIRKALGIPAEALVVGLVARWDPVKNVPGFMEVAGQLADRRPDLHFVLAGKGLDTNNAELVSMMSPSAKSRYHLMGPRSDIPSVMSSLDFFVLPSLGEGFPNALGEAMAAGMRRHRCWRLCRNPRPRRSRCSEWRHAGLGASDNRVDGLVCHGTPTAWSTRPC
jgi:glycosyltransferase involved in cell wall biosynthesis